MESHLLDSNNKDITIQTPQKQEKQLPKPILFLRKQKEAREQPPKLSEYKYSDQKSSCIDSSSKIIPGSISEQDLPFELA